MPLRGDLGPSAAALLVLLFAPVLAFVVRRRWRLAVARREEVRRLALLAAQEASRAEVEAMEAYAAAWTSAAVAAKGVSKDPSARPECPVCFCPAIARCARCKAVRYCSGKCQIVHWRQGHKDECHPPPVNDNYNGATSVSCSKVVQAEQPGLEHKEDLNMKAVEMSFERAAASESRFSPDDLNEDDCLAFTRPLTAYLLEGLHSKRCPKKDWCFTCEFESLVMNTKQGKSPLSPIGILSHLHNIGSNFGHGKEEDAHEFLRYAIDIMQSVCLKEAGAKPDDVLAEETTLIQQTFGGYLQSRIRCYRCKSNSERCERMMDLTVEIHGDIATLDEALSCFTSPEILDGKNKYECDRCKSRERARKRLSILEAPNVLTIVLKRFQSGKYGKLNKAVRFPEYLNLAHYMSRDDASSMYQLYAVIVHKDVMNASFSGHYVCYVKDTQGKWYKIDDSEVKPVELKKVLSKSAYMLLYARCSPHAPSLVRKAISHDPLQARKIRSKEASGKSGGSSITEQRSHFYPQPMMGDRANFQSSDLFRPPLNDSSSDNSSLFDEGSSCSTESTRDSASTEENWECMSGESDCINSNSLRRSKESNGLTHSPLFSRHSSKKVLHDDSGRNASSSGREIDHVEVGRLAPMKHQGGRTTCSEGSKSSSFLYHDKSQTCRVTEHCSTVETDWINPSEVKSGVVLRRPSREITAQTFY